MLDDKILLWNTKKQINILLCLLYNKLKNAENRYLRNSVL